MADQQETVGALQPQREASYVMHFKAVPCGKHEGPFVACEAHDEYQGYCDDCFKCPDCRTGIEAYMENNPQAKVTNLSKYPDAA